MDEQDVCDGCKNEMAFLETLAFFGMQQNTIVLRPDLLRKARKESKCSFSKDPHLLNIDLLKSLPCRGTGTENETEKDHCFVHLSFQECYAARYLIKALHYGPREKAIEFIQHQKYNRRFSLLFRFVSGLAVQNKCQETIKFFWHTIIEAPLDLVGIRHIQLVMNCFDGVEHNLDFPYRSLFLSWIQVWIRHVLQSDNLVLQDHLTSTLESCISIMYDSTIQTTFTHLLGTYERLKHQIRVEYGHLRLQIDQRLPFSSDIINRLSIRIPETRTHGTATIYPFEITAATSAEIDHLVIALEDENPVVRWSACDAVGKIGKKAGTSAVLYRLAVTLADDDWEVRRSACDAIRSIVTKAGTSALLNRLVVALADENSVVRLNACRAVGSIGEKEATSAMVDRLTITITDPDW